MVFERLRQGPLGLAQRALGCRGRRRERTTESLNEELVRFFVEHEGACLACATNHAARRTGIARQMLALPTRGTAGQLRGKPGCQQQLRPEGERVGSRRARSV